MAKNSQPIVAELGRPETAEEVAARKSEASRLHRVRQTMRNLLASLGVCALAVIVLVAVVPRDDSQIVRDVDYAAVAESAQADVSHPLVAPALSDEWTSNEAELRTGADGVVEWYIGFIKSDDAGEAAEYVGVSQGIDANPTWLAERVAKRDATGSISLAGFTWSEYDYTDLPSDDTGNNAYTLTLEHDGSTIVVYGSHAPETVQVVAESISQELEP